MQHPRGLSKNDEADLRNRAAGVVCRGQKAPCAFNKDSFLNFFKVQKTASACQKDFFDKLRGCCKMQHPRGLSKNDEADLRNRAAGVWTAFPAKFFLIPCSMFFFATDPSRYDRIFSKQPLTLMVKSDKLIINIKPDDETKYARTHLFRDLPAAARRGVWTGRIPFRGVSLNRQ